MAGRIPGHFLLREGNDGERVFAAGHIAKM